MNQRNVVSLVRVSGKHQAEDDKTGIKRQQQDIAVHCQQHGLTVVKEIGLEGISGAYIQESRQYKLMLSVLKKPDVVGICFATLDRFFRPENIATFSDVFKPIVAIGGNKKLFCDLGEISLNDPNDFLKLTIWGSMAGFERARINQRMSRGRDILRATDTASVDQLPKGIIFVRENDRSNFGHFEYTEYAHDVVKVAFQRAANGDSLSEIARELGIGTRRYGGRYATLTALRKMFQSKWWLGFKVKHSIYVKDPSDSWDDAKNTVKRGKRIELESPKALELGITIPKIEVRTNLADEPLISLEVWQAVQERLQQNTKTWTQNRTRTNEFLAHGLIFCECGSKMYAKRYRTGGRTSDRYLHYYVCGRRDRLRQCDMPMIPAQGPNITNAKGVEIETGIDADIRTAIIHEFQTDNFVESKLDEAIRANNSDEKKEAVLAAERLLNNAEKEKSNLIAAIRKGVPAETVLNDLKELDQTIKDATVKLRLARAEASIQLNTKAAADKIRETYAGFGLLSLEEQKERLRQYVERIIVHRVPNDPDDPDDNGCAVWISMDLRVPQTTENERVTSRARNSKLESATRFTFQFGVGGAVENQPVACVHKHVQKFGKNKYGVQRFLCLDCNRRFYHEYNTINLKNRSANANAVLKLCASSTATPTAQQAQDRPTDHA